jgi:hypothetical protein
MKTYTHHLTTKATPALLWPLYENVANWTLWDQELETVQLNGPFQAGSVGMLKPKGGPATRFRLTEVNPRVSFSDVSFLPLCQLYFKHSLEVSEGVTKLTHIIRFKGPLSFLWSRILGPKMAVGLPLAMKLLAEMGEREVNNQKHA